MDPESHMGRDRFSWKQVVTTKSPPAREGAGMAYDPTLGHVIIFGGQNSEVPLGDTWETHPVKLLISDLRLLALGL